MFCLVLRHITHYGLAGDMCSRRWVVDDTELPKQVTDSAVVVSTPCGQFGKQQNCREAESVSLASDSQTLSFYVCSPDRYSGDLRRHPPGAHGLPLELSVSVK